MHQQGDAPDHMPRGARVEDLLQFLGRPHMLATIFQIGAAHDRPVRFTEIRNALDISQNTLSERLKELVAAGLVSRRSYDEIPPRVEYAPTPELLALVPAFRLLHTWCDEHTLEPSAPEAAQ